MIVVGTAGWSIPRACQPLVPGEGTHLARYAQALRGAEINSSFHRAHSRDTYRNWARQTPAAFRFAVKLPGQITHDLRLRAARRPLAEFLDQFAGLGRRLGPLVVQLPPSMQFEPRVVRTFFTLLREQFDGLVACEPRHASWFGDRAQAIFEQHRIARIAADPAVVDAAAVPGGWGGLCYFRLHGSPRKYWSDYDAQRLEAWSGMLQRLPRGTDAWCIFDNTASGAALGNALQMSRLLLSSRRPAAPSRPARRTAPPRRRAPASSAACARPPRRAAPPARC
jgi:uncharacterized protein YecE (DUF72 family)